MVILGENNARIRSAMILIFLGIAYFGCTDVVAKVCYLDQEQDRQGKLRWVQPSERDDRCACTSLRPGGVNMMRPRRHEEPQYTDNPMFTDNVKEIKGYFNCPVDSISPNIACPSAIIQKVTQNADGTEITWTSPTATDNSGVPPKVTLVSDSRLGNGSTFTIGKYVIIYTATDEAANSARCKFNISVEDARRPSFTRCPKDITKIISDENGSVAVEWDEPEASDNSGVEPTVANETPDKGRNFTLGTHIVTYRATDGAGNSQICSFNIYVVNRGVSLDGVSAQQSTNWSYTARAAVDGTIKTFSITARDDLHPWWLVALGGEHCLVRITVTRRVNFGHRFVGVVARAGLSSNYTFNQQCGLPASDQSVNNGVVQFLCDPPLWATYVHLYKDSTLLDVSNRYLEIAEIAVEEYPVSEAECGMHMYEVTTLANETSVKAAETSLSEIPLLEKLVYQSSTYGVPHTAKNAIDGNVHTFSHTGYMDPHPWWIMDLVNEHCLGIITVSLRIAHHTTAAKVRAGVSSNFTDNQQCGPLVIEAESLERTVVSFKCAPPVKARYISLDLEAPSPGVHVVLALAELVVVQRSPWECSSYQVVPVVGKIASQSGSVGGWLPAGNAIDGNRSTFSSTVADLSSGIQLWWQVDLAETHCLGRISVDLGEIGNLDNFTGAVARGGVSSDYTQNQQCGSTVTADQVYDGAMISFVCDPPVTARYVSLDIDPSRSGNSAVLRIAEVTIGENVTSQCPVIEY